MSGANLEKQLLEIAKRDLEASILLYENKLYPQAMFYFQQCGKTSKIICNTFWNNK